MELVRPAVAVTTFEMNLACCCCCCCRCCWWCWCCYICMNTGFVRILESPWI